MKAAGFSKLSTLLALAISLFTAEAIARDQPGEAELRLFPGSAVLVGKVEADEACREGESMIWVASGSTLIYQTAVQAGNTFEFHVMPGPLELTVTSQSGCISETKFSARANEIKDLKLTLEPAGKKYSRKSTRDPASSGFCAYCGGLSYSYYRTGVPMTMPGFQSAPWWTQYCTYSYSNCYYPGAWMNGGIYGPAYPGSTAANVPLHGAGVMGKPNIYVTAPAGTELKIRLDPPAGTNVLAAVPRHGVKGWDTLALAPYQLKSGDSRTAYLYYDYRFNPRTMQDEEGFCVEADKLMPELTKALEAAGFAANEIRDFREHWLVKMPRAENYCVYPQDDRQLAQVAPLKIEPAPETFMRVGFMIIPQETGRTPLAFQAKPKREWKPYFRAATGKLQAVSDSAGRKPASEKSVVVREWGVGFLKAR